MSERKSTQDHVNYIAAWPIFTVRRAAVLVSRIIVNAIREDFRVDGDSSKPLAAPAVAKPDQPVIKNDRLPKQFPVADLVDSQLFGSVKVCFYQYLDRNFIRAVARKNSVPKELYFTPEIAKNDCLVYNMKSAIEWVKKTGFAGVLEPAGISVAPAVQDAVALPHRTGGEKLDKDEPAQETQVAMKAPAKPNVMRSASPLLRDWMVGRITNIGRSTRPATIGPDKKEKPGYVTFVIKLRSDEDGVVKEFAGEHLAELAETLDLKEKQLVRLRQLGRNPFQVADPKTGLIEERTRNEFAIELIAD